MYTHLPQVLTILLIRVYSREVTSDVVVLDRLLHFVVVVEIAFGLYVYFGAFKRFVIIPNIGKGSTVFFFFFCAITSVDFCSAFSRCHIASAFWPCANGTSEVALTIDAIVSATVRNRENRRRCRKEGTGLCNCTESFPYAELKFL